MTRFFNLSDNFLAKFSSLEEALWLLEARLTSRVDGDPIESVLGQVWAGESPAISVLDAAAVAGVVGESQLTGESLGFPIGLGVVEGATLKGANSALQASAEASRARIVLNADWLGSATTGEIEAILLAHLDEALLQQAGNQQLGDDRLAGRLPALSNAQPTLASDRSSTQSPAATATTDVLVPFPPSVINLDLIDAAYHLKGCGCGACGLQDPLTADAKQAKVKPTATAALLGPAIPVAAPAAAASIQILANYLRSEYWAAAGKVSHKYNLGTTGNNPNSGVLYYNVSGWASDPDGLTPDRKTLVRRVFKDYKTYLGIIFVETASTGTEVDIFFRDNASGAYAAAKGTSFSDGVDWTEINIAANWFGSSSSYNGYTPQTVQHEIGHALGLGHMGNYNGTVNYDTQAVYANDSWNVSMMSYLPVNRNPYFSAYNPNTAAQGLSYVWLSTPGTADYVALSNIYGSQGYSTNNAFTGDTIYGMNTNITAAVSEIWSLFSTYGGLTGYTLVDASGIDTLDVSNFNQNQKIDLRVATLASTSATLCDIGGLKGNITISAGTVVENASGGGGSDLFYGNEAQNRFKGNAGNDQFYDSLASDTYYGGLGNDSVYFAESINLYAFSYNASTSFLSVARSFTTDVDLVFNDIEALYFNSVGYAFASFVGANRLTGTAYADILNGNAGIDTISGLAGADSITGGAGLDTLSGGADADSFLYTTLTDGRVGGTSTARTFESITDFQVGLDRINAPGTTVRNFKVLGAVTALTDTAIGALLNATPLGGTANFAANGASTFTFGTGATMRTFLAINNGTAAYSSTADAIVDITGYGLFNGATSLANLSIS